MATIALWGHTLDPHPTGLRIALWRKMLDQHHTGLRHVNNSSMGGHTGPISLWLRIALWGKMLDQHHTGLRHVNNSSMGGGGGGGGDTGPTSHCRLMVDRRSSGTTCWTYITLGCGRLTMDQHLIGLRLLPNVPHACYYLSDVYPD